MKKNFAFMSDNAAPVHQNVMHALTHINANGFQPPYGEDDETAEVAAMFRGRLGPGIEVFFVFGGTGANVLGLSSMVRPHESIICAESAHINQDEAGAPERFTGSKLLVVPGENGKLTWRDIEQCLGVIGDQHHVQPKVVSISQPTEYGTVYSGEELAALGRFVHKRGMYLHVDGARIANAEVCTSTDFRIRNMGSYGVDVMSFGGTKNGMMFGEAVVFYNRQLAEGFRWTQKQGMQLPSKMRYVAAQFRAMFNDDLWLENARHANEMARRLADGIRDLRYENYTTRPVQTNAVFAYIGGTPLAELRERYACYVWDGKFEFRLMTSWATTEQDVDELIAYLDARQLPDLHPRKR